MAKSITYKDAGVDIEAADRLVDFIRPLAKTTFRKEVVSDIGGFGGINAIISTNITIIASDNGNIAVETGLISRFI